MALFSVGLFDVKNIGQKIHLWMKSDQLNCDKNDIGYEELTDDETIKNVLTSEKPEKNDVMNQGMIILELIMQTIRSKCNN